MTTVGDAFLRLALVSLHSVLWAREAVGRVWLWLCTAVAFSLKHKGKKLECIAADRKELQKVPTHLALVIQEEHISCDDLACLAVWAFASDVRTVSIYDPYGETVSCTVNCSWPVWKRNGTSTVLKIVRSCHYLRHNLCVGACSVAGFSFLLK